MNFSNAMISARCLMTCPGLRDLSHQVDGLHDRLVAADYSTPVALADNVAHYFAELSKMFCDRRDLAECIMQHAAECGGMPPPPPQPEKRRLGFKMGMRYHHLAQAKALSLPHQARHRAASLAKYITEKHRTGARKLKVRKLREDSSDGTSTSGNEDETSSSTDETDGSSSNADGTDKDSASNNTDETDKEVPEHEEHRCHEGKCSMQVHELNDFLNHTSLRNLSGDDMTAICLMGLGVETCMVNTSCCGQAVANPVAEHDVNLWHMCEGGGYRYAQLCHQGPDMPEPDMCDEEKLEGCMPFIQDAVELLNGTNLTGLDSDRSRHLCALAHSSEACLYTAGCCSSAGDLFPESMHDFDMEMVCGPVDYPHSSVCREDPLHPEPPDHEAKCDREKLKDCDRYITELSHMVNMSNSSNMSGFTTDEMKDMCYFAYAIESCFLVTGCCEDAGELVPVHLHEMNVSGICHGAGYNHESGMLCRSEEDRDHGKDGSQGDGSNDEYDSDGNHKESSNDYDNEGSYEDGSNTGHEYGNEGNDEDSYDDQHDHLHHPHDDEHRCNESMHMCDSLFKDLSDALANSRSSDLEDQKLCLMSIAVEACFASTMCCGKIQQLTDLGQGYGIHFADRCAESGFRRPVICQNGPMNENDTHGEEHHRCNRTAMQSQCNASIDSLVRMLPSMHVSGSNMSNDTEVASMSNNISSWNLSASEMESICMAAWDVETCLFNQTCCHEAERLLPAQLLELDPREICESAGRNYTSVCDQGHHDDHDQEDRCSQCNPPLHDLEHMISTMNMSTASADELELACMMSITVETCFAYSHCCDQLEDLLHLPSGDGNKTDFASICSGVGLWRPSICEAVHPPPHEHDEHDDGNGRDEDMCNHTGMQACNASIQMLSQLVMNSTQNGTHNMSEDDAARVCAMASGVEMCIHNMSCCRDAEYYLPKSLIDMDVEHTCHLGGMNATHYCSKGDDDHSHSHCDRPAFDTCGAAVDELTDLVNRSRLIPHLHKPNTTHNTSGTEHHMHNMTGPMMNMTVLHNMSIDELGEICLMGIGIESCLLNTTCCEDAETILPASLMGVDLGVVCEHAGYRYAPICRRGEDHMHCDHRALDACREVGRKMEEELHFLESEPDRVCHLGNEITDCIRRAGCCEDQEADHLVPEDVMTRLLPTCVARGYVYVCDDRPPHEGECDKMAKFHCDMERLNMTMAMSLISDDGSISPDFLQKSCEVSQMTTMCYERAHCCGEREMEDLGSMSSMCETMGMHFSCMKDDGGHHHGQEGAADFLHLMPARYLSVWGPARRARKLVSGAVCYHGRLGLQPAATS